MVPLFVGVGFEPAACAVYYASVGLCAGYVLLGKRLIRRGVSSPGEAESCNNLLDGSG